jgi:dTMP kinase
MQWLHNLDYKLLKNPKPDLVIFLDMPVKYVVKLMKDRARKRDGHENDKQHLKNTYQAYLDACQKFKYWQSIKCIQNNRLLTIQEVHNKIWERLKTK